MNLKQREILPFAATGTNVEGALLSHISQTQTEKNFIISLTYRI